MVSQTLFEKASICWDDLLGERVKKLGSVNVYRRSQMMMMIQIVMTTNYTLAKELLKCARERAA